MMVFAILLHLYCILLKKVLSVFRKVHHARFVTNIALWPYCIGI